jgi:hypothetical protein
MNRKQEKRRLLLIDADGIGKGLRERLQKSFGFANRGLQGGNLVAEFKYERAALKAKARALQLLSEEQLTRDILITEEEL